MTKTTKNLIIKMFLGFAICILLTTTVYSFVDINGSGDGYTEGQLRTSTSADDSIKNLIVDAAAYFLQANSDIMKFSSLYELSATVLDLDFDESREIVNSALYNIRQALDKYSRLVTIAENTPYYQPVIVKLETFNYSGYMRENGLNSEIFSEVESYLSVGNINGVYKNVYQRVKRIEITLEAVESALNNDSLPELDDVWTLNDNCSSKLLYGIYVSEVFFALRNSQ